MYVDTLIGADTVNTMPKATAGAFAAHGKVTKSLVRAVPEARQTLKALRSVGIDLRQVTWQLENEGIQKFIEPFDKLLAGIDSKRSALTAGQSSAD